MSQHSTIKRAYHKTYATPKEIATKLAERGLVACIEGEVEKFILLHGYERISPYIESLFSSKKDHFSQEMRFEEAHRRYLLDLKWRPILFDLTGAFETWLKAHLLSVLGEEFGSHPYYERQAYQSEDDMILICSHLMDVFKRSKDGRAKDYRQKYAKPVLPPVWDMIEICTFGSIVRWISMLSNMLQNKISKAFGLQEREVFLSWLKTMVELRNLCAHHGRLFNLCLINKPRVYQKENIPQAQTNTLKAALEILDYLCLKRVELMEGYPNFKPRSAVAEIIMASFNVWRYECLDLLKFSGFSHEEIQIIKEKK